MNNNLSNLTINEQFIESIKNKNYPLTRQLLQQQENPVDINYDDSEALSLTILNNTVMMTFPLSRKAESFIWTPAGNCTFYTAHGLL